MDQNSVLELYMIFIYIYYCYKIDMIYFQLMLFVKLYFSHYIYIQ